TEFQTRLADGVAFMLVPVNCPHAGCGGTLLVAEGRAEQPPTCPLCGQVITIIQPGGATQPDHAPPGLSTLGAEGREEQTRTDNLPVAPQSPTWDADPPPPTLTSPQEEATPSPQPGSSWNTMSFAAKEEQLSDKDASLEQAPGASWETRSCT